MASKQREMGLSFSIEPSSEKVEPVMWSVNPGGEGGMLTADVRELHITPWLCTARCGQHHRLFGQEDLTGRSGP